MQAKEIVREDEREKKKEYVFFASLILACYFFYTHERERERSMSAPLKESKSLHISLFASFFFESGTRLKIFAKSEN